MNHQSKKKETFPPPLPDEARGILPPPLPEEARVQESKENGEVVELSSDDLKELSTKTKHDMKETVDKTNERGDALLVKISEKTGQPPSEEVVEKMHVLSGEAERAGEELSTGLKSVEDPEVIKKQRVESHDEQLQELRNHVHDNFNILQQMLEDGQEKKSERQTEQIKGQLLNLMEAMHTLSQNIDPEIKQETLSHFIIVDKMKEMTKLKKGTSKEISQAFSDIFDEFNDFIEDEVVAQLVREIRREKTGISIEHVIRELYGRTPEEVNQIKEKNRSKVVEAMKRMKEEGAITTDTITELHEINNRGIVPKSFSDFRSGSMGVTFGKRIGTLPKDVLQEVEGVVERANSLLEGRRNKKYSKTDFQIATAMLHNQLLDIHPFPDRNGSTSLLLMELLMSHQGYKPSPKREGNYYKTVRRTLGHNPVAIGVVGYEHYLIANKPGHFEGDTIDDETAEIYDRIIERHHGNIKSKLAA